MALSSGSLGSLLQGVSQQPARVRLKGQVSEQINMISDVSKGLSTRPATDNGSTLDRADAQHKFQNIKFRGQDYIIGYKNGDIQIWTLEGVRQNIQYRNSGSPSYISNDMVFHSVEDRIIALNRNKVVRKSTAVDGRDWYVGLFNALGGQFLKTYAVTVTFSDGSVISADYTAPDGTSSGDAAQVASDFIVSELVSGLLSDPNLPPGTQISRAFDVGRVYHPTLKIDIGVADGAGGTILRATSDSVRDVEDLPRFAPNGTIVQVVSSDADEDNYWLKFDAKRVIPENGSAGFGSEGIWREWYNPEEEREFNLSTMPHTLVYENGTFYLEQGPWNGRSVGDKNSAPFPSIIDKKLRDVAGFESRIALLSQDTVVMSRTNVPFDLWRESATVVSATDPIDITSTKKDELALDWFVPFDRDLFVVSDPGNSQFVIRGGLGVTPENIGMVLTTEFEISSGGTPPISTGRSILFAFNTGKFSGIKEFYTDSDNAVQAANSLTETQDRYIVGQVIGSDISQSFSLAVFRTDASPKFLYVYKYLWDGRELLQSSWSKWEFKDNIRHAFFDDNTMYLVSIDLDNDVFIHSMDLNRPEGEYGYHEMLDRRVTRTVDQNEIELPYDNAKFLQGAGCPNPGLETRPVFEIKVNALRTKYIFEQDVIPNGATVICGQEIPWLLDPTEVYGVDYQQRVDTSQKITIQDYIVHVENSGEFKAIGFSPYSDPWEYSAYVFPLDNEPLDPDRLIVQTGEFYIPWGERADWSTLRLAGNDIRPVTILELEWVGQILRTKGRRA